MVDIYQAPKWHGDIHHKLVTLWEQLLLVWYKQNERDKMPTKIDSEEYKNSVESTFVQ